MNPFEFVIAIIAITTIGSIIKARMGIVDRRKERFLSDDDRDRDNRRDGYGEQAEAVRLKEEVRMLKERIQTLERIAVDKENTLARQIDDLRDR